MENPNTWTDLHHAIENILWSCNPSQSFNPMRHIGISTLLNNEGYSTTPAQILKIIDDWTNDEAARFLSLSSTILNSLEKDK